jgi:hypothetical protein
LEAVEALGGMSVSIAHTYTWLQIWISYLLFY